MVIMGKWYNSKVNLMNKETNTNYTCYKKITSSLILIHLEHSLMSEKQTVTLSTMFYSVKYIHYVQRDVFYTCFLRTFCDVWAEMITETGFIYFIIFLVGSFKLVSCCLFASFYLLFSCLQYSSNILNLF